MTTLGGLKSYRTKVKKELLQMGDVIDNTLKARNELPGADAQRLVQLEANVGDLLELLKEKLDRLELATDRVNTCCIENQNQAE